MQHNKISKAKARLNLGHPFFATLLVQTPVEITDAVPLAATDGETVYFNPDFLEKCSVEDTMAVLVHEVGGHDALLHSIRMGARDPELWNIACDHAINNMLVDQGFKCPASVPGGWLCDPQYKGWAADRIYDDLARQQSAKPQQGNGKPGSGDPSDGSGNGKPGSGSGSGKPGDSNPSDGLKRDALHGDVLPAKAKSEPERQAAAQKARQKVAAAANIARMAGKFGGDLALMVEGMLATKVPWSDVLRDHMTEIVRTRDNWSRRNRRYKSVYLPSRGSKAMGPMIFIPDSSGSMLSESDLRKVCSEMAHCVMQTQPESIRVVWADAKVQSEQVFDPQDFSYEALKPVGGGGTDMRVPLKYVEKYDPQVVVLLTDGYTPWPDVPCPFPVICLNTTTKKCPSWLQVIEI